MRTFSSPKAFADFLRRMLAQEEAAAAKGLEAGARIVLEEAKGSMGRYQDKSGPFPAWKPLADDTKKDRVRQGFPADEPLLRSGRLRDSIEHNIRGEDAYVGSRSKLAEIQEFGSKDGKLPPRSFIGGAAARKAKEAADAMVKPSLDLLAGRRVAGGSRRKPKGTPK